MPNTNYQTIYQMGNAVNDILKQATGRDDVQNIDMGFVTVARNHRMVHEEYSGSVVSFEAHVETPMGLIVQIDPVQDLHGYDNPWPTGGGVNLLDASELTVYGTTTYGLTTTIITDGFRVSGTTPDDITPGRKQWRVVKINQTLDLSNLNIVGFYNGSYGTHSILLRLDVNTSTIVIDITNLSAGETFDFTVKPVVYSGSTAPTAWTPYSNICPISGWTGCNVTVSPTQDAEDGTTYSIAFPSSAGTVYGGTLTINRDGTGELVVDRGYLNATDATWSDARSGRVYTSLPLSPTELTTVLCSHCEYHRRPATGAYTDWVDWGGYPNSNRNLIVTMAGITDTLNAWNAYIQSNDVEFVYYLETPVTYQLTELEVIKTLMGVNNVWANTGDITVQFTDLLED